MGALTKIILRFRKTTILLFLAAAVACALQVPKVRVNYNMMDYLPDESPSTVALDVMDQEFDQSAPNAQLMLTQVSLPEALEYKRQLKLIDGIDEVNWLDDAADLNEPLELIPKKTLESWYLEGDAVFSLTVDTDKQGSALRAVRALVGEKGALSGDCVNTAAATESTGAELSQMMSLALVIVLIILFATTTSWFEPVLFMITIGVAIVLNTGTNLMFGEISFVTQAAASILQLAVSMDYSIFLLHRFAEYRQEGEDVQHAMLQAVKKSTSSILSSGLTTVIGFAALILMKFKIGPDMGYVMAKAIFFSLLCVLVLLPALSISCYKLIDRSAHRSFMPTFEGFARFARRASIPALVVFLALIAPCYLGQQANGFLYGSSGMFGDAGTQVGRETQMIEAKFGKSNAMVLMVPKGDLGRERALSQALLELPEVSSLISYANTVGTEIPMEFIPRNTLSQLISDTYSRMVLTVNTSLEGEDAFRLVETVRALAQAQYPGRYLLAGQSVNTYDMRDVVRVDSQVVNAVAIGAIALILLFTFRSLSLPLILLLVIEASIWINLTVPYLMGETLFYISYLIISSVQLGATVDYAILLTNRYLENRTLLAKRPASERTVSETTLSILTSASILTVCGCLMGALCTNRVISQLGFLVGRGAVLSAALVLLVLPRLLTLFDRLIQRTTLGAHFIVKEVQIHEAD